MLFCEGIESSTLRGLGLGNVNKKGFYSNVNKKGKGGKGTK